MESTYVRSYAVVFSFHSSREMFANSCALSTYLWWRHKPHEMHKWGYFLILEATHPHVSLSYQPPHYSVMAWFFNFSVLPVLVTQGCNNTLASPESLTNKHLLYVVLDTGKCKNITVVLGIGVHRRPASCSIE